jgi:hypothetical protein
MAPHNSSDESATRHLNYTPLDQPKHEIRVVRLHPRRWSTDSTIICDITTVDQRTAPTCPRYEALSYEWGSPSSKEYTIHLNRRSIPVRHNLWCALYELRDACESRTLWIDALCIYFERYRTEYRRNLRFRPLLSEGFRFTLVGSGCLSFPIFSHRLRPTLVQNVDGRHLACVTTCLFGVTARR